MDIARCDVVVVGAGFAGLTAGIGLARAGFAVVVVEAAAKVGGGLGGVCFIDNLAQPDILGTKGVEALERERRLIERGLFATDGRRLFGGTYRDAEALGDCFLVGQPFFDGLAHMARESGVDLRMETSALALIRDGRRVLGIATSRGPIYGNLVFLAEGDVGHLVSREGFERSNEGRAAPTFLYCLQQILELSAETIEKRFHIGPDEGVAWELLLRNPGLPLNARGFVRTNRQSVALNVVLPAENLRRHFQGEPRQLVQWLQDMPALRPWYGDGRPGAWNAGLIRAGGMRDIPYLIEDGLAVGGAAAGLGVDFPILDRTGPATVTGLLLSRAARRIREEGGDFRAEQLLRHYVEPLRQTRYWNDAAFLHRWPNYLRKTPGLFDRPLDLLLDTAAIWTRRRRWLPGKWFAWLVRLVRVRWAEWSEWRDEILHLGHALRLSETASRPAWGFVLLDGALNALRDLSHRPRPNLPTAGTFRLQYHSAEEDASIDAAPALMRRWFQRFRPVLASAGRLLYRNDDKPLSVKNREIVELLLRQINLLDGVVMAALALAMAPVAAALAVLIGLLRRLRFGEGKMFCVPAGHASDTERGSELSIHIVWKSAVPHERADAVRDLPHVCPAGVFAVDDRAPEGVTVRIDREKCIRCEACWRMNPCVDWGRAPSLPVAVSPPRQQGMGIVSPPRQQGMGIVSPPRQQGIVLDLLDKMDRKIEEFDLALAHGPAAVDRARGDHLEMLARYAQQLALRLRDVLAKEDAPTPAQDLAAALAAKAEERTRRTWDGRFAWAVADGWLLRQHHLPQLRGWLAEDSGAPALRPVETRRDAERPDVRSHAEGGNEGDAAVMHASADRAAQCFLHETLDRTSPSVLTPARAELLAAMKTDATSKLALDADALRTLLDVPGDWATLQQRRALLAEREEIHEAEQRLLALAEAWTARRESADFARQTAQVLAGKLLLLRTHALLEEGEDVELAIPLLRVWLDRVADSLDEFTLFIEDRLRPTIPDPDRPLIEPGVGPPPRSLAEYLAVPAPYVSGDFLLAPLDLLQPRPVPEMEGVECAAGEDAPFAYLFGALDAEMRGRQAHPHTRGWDLEANAARLVLLSLRPNGDGLSERCLILQALAGEVVPRWLRGGLATGARHLGRDVLQLESLKEELRHRLRAVWQLFGDALGRNADVQASCFALAEATAWLKGADSVLGRLGWLSRLCQAEEREEPAALRQRGRRELAHCFAVIRDRLRRFDDDLAALRRGYYAPHVRAAALLSARKNPRAQAPP